MRLFEPVKIKLPVEPLSFEKLCVTVILPPMLSTPPVWEYPAVLRLPVVESVPAAITKLPLLVKELKEVLPATPLS